MNCLVVTSILFLLPIDGQSTGLGNIAWMVAALFAAGFFVLLYFFRKSQQLNEELTLREQKLEEANLKKDRLFFVIGHDLKSPVSNILLVLQAIIDKKFSRQSEEQLLQLLWEDAIITLQSLDNLYQWGKLQINGISIRQGTFAPHHILQQKIALLTDIAIRKNISITNNVPLHITTYADPEHFGIIISNLLYNAIKFTPDGGSIAISAHTDAQQITFQVSDNGIGISKARQEELFNQMNTIEYGTSNEKGMGIGLQLCKQFINGNGGDLWIKSEHEKGASFFFSLKDAS